MIITKKVLPRRMVVRGIGAALALPLLDSMVPPLMALERTSVKPPRRFGVVYVPNGIHMEDWTPVKEGGAFELRPILKPLESYRDQLTVLSGLSITPSGHTRGSTAFLTGVSPQPGPRLKAGISLDQLLASKVGGDTQLRSMEMALESADSGGSCESGLSCTYLNTISWSASTSPLPLERDPRVVFERLFGDIDSTNRGARLARLRRTGSLLDAFTVKLRGLHRQLGPSDQQTLDQYFESVRSVERRVQRAEAQNVVLPTVERPTGIPATYKEHAELMFDLQALAYQTDLTRVTTFMIGREFSGRSYPEIGVPEAHHPTSHHDNDPAKLAKLTKINAFHVSSFARFLDTLQSIPDGDGTLLDHVVLLYGSGLSDGNAHSGRSLPILLAGRGAGAFTGGMHMRYAGDPPLSNLHLTILNRFGIEATTFGSSSGLLQDLI